MKLPTRPPSLLAAGILAAIVGLTLSACSDESGPGGSDHGGAGAAQPHAALATAATDWPGVEARLLRSRRDTNVLSVEVALVNVGTSRVTIENYSAAEAAAKDDESEHSYAVFERPGLISASTGVTETLDPGESVIITAAFPVRPQTDTVTLTFPHIEPFSNITIEGAGRTRPGSPRNTNKPEEPAGAKEP